MTDENLRQMKKDMEFLLTKEFGDNYRIKTYEPRFSLDTGSRIVLNVEIEKDNQTRLFCIHRKTDNNRVILDALREVIHKQTIITERVMLEA